MVQRERGTRNSERGTDEPNSVHLFRVPRSAFRVRTYRTNKLPDPLLPSLVAVTSDEPDRSARTTTDWPDATSIRATVESLTLQNTARPDSGLPWASRSVAKKPAVSPAATTMVSGETDTVATESGGGGGRDSTTTSWAEPRFPWPGRDLGGARPQGTQDERLPELPLDPRDARVGHAPLHVPVADEVPLGIAQCGKETSAVAHGDSVGRRRDRHRRHGPGLAARGRICGRVGRRPEIRDQSATRSELVAARGSGDCRGDHAASEGVSHRASGEK